MDGASFILALIAILALAGVSIYFYMEFDKHKISNKEDYNKLATDINNEQGNRLSNMSSIVEQVNTINDDIKKTYDEANAGQNEKITNLGVKLDNIETGFGSLISATDIDSSSNLQLSNIADFKNVDYKLLKNISVVGGMTIKDVNKTNSFKICGGEPEKCIQFPDDNGNVFLTGFNNGSIMMGSETSFKNGITFLNDDVNYGTISHNNTPYNNGMMFKSENINLDGIVVFKGDIKDESGKLKEFVNNLIEENEKLQQDEQVSVMNDNMVNYPTSDKDPIVEEDTVEGFESKNKGKNIVETKQEIVINKPMKLRCYVIDEEKKINRKANKASEKVKTK